MTVRGWSAIAAVFGIVASVEAQIGTVSTPASREALLRDLASMLTEAKPVGAIQFAKLKDPLHPPEADLLDGIPIASPKSAEVGQVLSDADLLQVLAAKIRVTGSGAIGGEPFVLLTEKRLKIGDTIPVVNEGVEYGLEIVSIERSRVRLRYHSQEIVRPIK